MTEERDTGSLVQILLPVTDPNGEPFPVCMFEDVRKVLTERFGGMTFYRNAPAEGTWRSGSRAEKDEIVIAEVMTQALDGAWWRDYRSGLEARFQQDEIVIRALPICRL